MKTAVVALTIVLLAWGVLAFGAVYQWAYIPLLIGAAVVGVIGLVVPARRGVPKGLWLSLAMTVIAIALQLLPMPGRWLHAATPAADPLLRVYDLAYAATPGAPHPLSIDPPRTLLALACFTAFTLLFLGLARSLGRRGTRLLGATIIALGSIVALIGLVQRVNFDGRIYGFWVPEAPRPDSFGPFVNKDHFAGWMLMAIAISCGYLCGLAAKSEGMPHADWRRRVLGFASSRNSAIVVIAIAVLLMSFSTVMTLSRSGIISLAFVLSAFVWTAWRRRLLARHGVVVVGVVVLMTAAIAGLSGAGLIAGRLVAARFGATSIDLAGRVPIWLDTWDMIKAFPVTGMGLNTFTTGSLFFQTRVRELHWSAAHNEYLQLLAEGGVLVSIPALIAIVMFARTISREFRTQTPGSLRFWLRTGAVIGVLAIALQSCVEFSLQIPGNAALFSVICAVAAQRSEHQGARGD